MRAGRILFYDASHSLHNTASCATCHIEGGVDGIAWNLGSVTDDKGPMTTQSLKSINVTAPFHWRGEQLNGLADFRGAFPGLLGGADLTDEEFIAFEAFILSLETPPNPHQNRRRLLDDSIQPSGAIIGPGIAVPPELRDQRPGAVRRAALQPVPSASGRFGPRGEQDGRRPSASRTRVASSSRSRR